MAAKPDLEKEIKDAEEKAWDALSRSNFTGFGCSAAIWVHLAQLAGGRRPNPFKDLVDHARVVKLDKVLQSAKKVRR